MMVTFSRRKFRKRGLPGLQSREIYTTKETQETRANTLHAVGSTSKIGDMHARWEVASSARAAVSDFKCLYKPILPPPLAQRKYHNEAAWFSEGTRLGDKGIAGLAPLNATPSMAEDEKQEFGTVVAFRAESDDSAAAALLPPTLVIATNCQRNQDSQSLGRGRTSPYTCRRAPRLSRPPMADEL